MDISGIPQRSDALKHYSYEHEFAVVNKSYAKDMRWSLALYYSWKKHCSHDIPYYVVAPRAEIADFKKAFADFSKGRDWQSGLTFLSEEEFFSSLGIVVPETFGGWHRQQIVKMAFAKTGLSRNYLTVDSAIVFSKELIVSSLFEGNQLRTNSFRTKKSEFYQELATVGMKGWLHGELVGIERCFSTISSFVGNPTDDTNIYISGTGLFDSDLARDLEQYALENGVDGLPGLLQIAPYELGWYGEFVFTRHNLRHIPYGPHMMRLIESKSDAESLLNDQLKLKDKECGVMLQPPADDLVGPVRAFDRFAG